ncbi:heavy-metal-associated domain-containing protein [soil metagenome]
MSENPTTEQDYLVEGMTCSHCVASVTEEVSELAGVESVTVDVQVGGASRVTVVSTAPLPLDGVRAAVTDAGYRLVPA